MHRALFPLLATLGMLFASAALAQNYPVKPVRVLLGVSAGGLQDQLARGIVADLGALWKQPVIVENRAGSSGIAAAEAVFAAAPDGYTLLQTGNFNFLVNEFVRATPSSTRTGFTGYACAKVTLAAAQAAMTISATTTRFIACSFRADPLTSAHSREGPS
jgi:tripartite-type tricarboxylate transporter receptor subunit TctC